MKTIHAEGFGLQQLLLQIVYIVILVAIIWRIYAWIKNLFELKEEHNKLLREQNELLRQVVDKKNKTE